MTATNHALTGVLIAFVTGNPWVAIPAALISHFICDMIPHYKQSPDVVVAPGFRWYLVGEATVCFCIVLALFIMRPEHWLLASVCAFVATSPDFLSINEFITRRSGRVYHPGPIKRFTNGIQWFERPIGGVVELVWAGGCLVLLYQFV